MPQLNLARIVLEHAKTDPAQVREALNTLHQRGETVSDILQFVREINAQKIKVPSPGWPVFSVSGLPNRNLELALSIKLAEKFSLSLPATPGSPSYIESTDFVSAKSPSDVTTQMTEKNLSFVDLDAFNPSLSWLKSAVAPLDHSTILDFIEPFLNPIPLMAQVIGVPSLEMGEKLAETALSLGQKVCCLYDTSQGAPGASVHGATKFWTVGLHDQAIHTGVFFPEEYEIETAKDDFPAEVLTANLLAGIADPISQSALTIDQRVITEFFNHFQ